MEFIKKEQVWRVNSQIERNFPFGLSGVGLLVHNNQVKERPKYWGGYENDSPALRTILAWTDKGYIFFISGGPAYWKEAGNFVLSLRNVVSNFLKDKQIRINLNQFLGTFINAIMLDGGLSAKFGYHLNPKKSTTYSGFSRQHDDSAPSSKRYLTTYITAEAKFKE